MPCPDFRRPLLLTVLFTRASVAPWFAPRLAASNQAPLPAQPYRWHNVAIGGGGFVTGLLFHPTEPGLLYARTDVGGSYRREGADSAWVPLQDSVGRADWNLLGVESVAVDPRDASRVYLATGTYVHREVGNGALLSSQDRGRTWTRTPLPFPLGANEPGRNSGERLVVDPNDGRILYLGTRTAGLWRSADAGTTWSPVGSFPELPDDSVKERPSPNRYNPLSRPIGVAVVVFDPRGQAGEPTRRIYAAISRADRGLLFSEDAGATWERVPGQPAGLRPTDLTVLPGGTLLATFADLPGPNRMSAGAVWSFDPETRAWTEITPEKGAFGYACITFDPSRPQTVLVSTWNHPGAEEIFRSPDAGRTWHPLLAGSSWDHSAAPYTEAMRVHWVSSVVVDPHDSDRVLFTTGYGVWQSANATACDRGEPVRWSIAVRGIEETVPLALVSPSSGPHLVSGLGDIDGFVHEDLDASPAKGPFDGPRFKNTESIDYAETTPLFFVRSGTTYQMDVIHGAWSADGGATWSRFASEPPPGDGIPPHRTGPITVTADGRTIVWTLAGQLPYRSTDRGATWTACAGAPAGLLVAADRVAPEQLYGIDVAEGEIYFSADGARTFRRVQQGLPRQRTRFARPALRPVPGRAGEFWLTLENRAYHFTQLGRTRVEVKDVDGAASVGFGRPAEEDGYPAVYLAGQVRGEPGLFRSDDAGATWTRISDPDHQFGGAGLVTGDPQVFGRVYFATGGRGIFYGDPAR